MRGALGYLCLLLSACQYGYDLNADDREVINCTGHWDCDNNEVCRGIVSEEVACSDDGYLRVADGKATKETVDDEPALFFFCHEDRRFFPFCVDEQITACEDEDLCDGDEYCASPIDGGTAVCVVPVESAEPCATDSDCGVDKCYLFFVLESTAEGRRTERRCAECPSCW